MFPENFEKKPGKYRKISGIYLYFGEKLWLDVKRQNNLKFREKMLDKRQACGYNKEADSGGAETALTNMAA